MDTNNASTKPKLTHEQRIDLVYTTKPKLENRYKGLCVFCGEAANYCWYSPAESKELHLSGMCELCFEAMFYEKPPKQIKDE